MGETRDHLAAQLCRSLAGTRFPIRALGRAPSDERVLAALRHGALPHAGHVLSRLQGVGATSGLEIEHISPVPGRLLSGDGVSLWATFSAEKRARHRELLQTLGNLTLLEQPLNAGASNHAFPAKRSYYKRSGVRATAALADLSGWDATTIEARTATLTEELLTIWTRPDGGADEGDEHLVPDPRRAQES